MHSTTDTIIAASSPPGRSSRGLVRVSGPATAEVLARLVWPDIRKMSSITPCMLMLSAAAIHHQHADRANKLAIPCLAAWHGAPRSYTGQDLAEIQMPGSPAMLERTLRAGSAAGARMAEPGEFTFRAFMAGKLDLTQAEGVAATITAVSDAQLRAASALRHGRLGQFAAQLADRLVMLLALVEAGIDFTDQEDVVPVAPPQLLRQLTVLLRELREFIDKSQPWGTLEALPRVALAGEPNAGKSSLFNALLGRTRAVASPIAGTTRDVLEEPLTLTAASGAQIEVMLVDLAGLDSPTSALDQQVQHAARVAVARADLVLMIRSMDFAAQPRDAQMAACFFSPGKITPARVLHVATKADLCPARVAPAGAIAVSARDGRGLPELRAAIAAAIADRATSFHADVLALQPRHEAALRDAAENIDHAIAILADADSRHALPQPELLAAAMRRALDDLAALAGRLTPDDVLGRIFATFCVGK